jgi:hypothetical protein
MKLALVLTTINVPTVLALYRKCSTHSPFIMVGDRKTPKEAYEFALSLGNTSICLPESGHKWKCSELIGFDCLQRRNIGFLEALKAGAEAVVTIDDDNMPIATDYFDQYRKALYLPFSGVKVSGRDHWFDPGQFLVPPVVQRGFPIHIVHRPKFEPVTNANVGVASGLIIGDSDMDAYTRIGKAPVVGDVAMLARAGCVVDAKTYTIFNSQNSAVLREFVPAYFMMPGIGRYDDVYAALVVQRVMRERGYHVHLGPPFALQERNPHDLIVDLKAEIGGMQYVKAFADILDAVILPGKSVIEDTRTIYEALSTCPFIPEQAVKAAMAYLEDCESCA